LWEENYRVEHSVSRDTRQLILLAFTIFLSAQLIQPIFSLFLLAKGASPFEMGLILSLLSVTSILVRIALGYAAQRWGSWPLILLTLIGQPITFVAYAYATSPLWLFPIAVFQGITTTLFGPILMSTVSITAPEGKRGSTIGTYLLAYGVSTLIGPLISSFLLTIVDYSRLFVISAGISLLSFALLLPIRRSSVYVELKPPNTRDGQRRLGQDIDVKGILTSRNVIAIFTICALFSLTLTMLMNLFPVFAVQTLSVTPSTVALFISVRGLANTATRFPAGKLSDRVGRRPLIILAHAMGGVALLFFAASQHFVVLGVAMIIHGSGHAFRSVSEFALLGDNVPKRTLQLVTYAYATSYDVGATIGAALIGPLTAIFPVNGIFLTSGLLLFAGALIASFTRDSKSKDNKLS
jgi:MFS family permease